MNRGKERLYNLSIRCYYRDGNYNTHKQELKLSNLKKWIDAYIYTHPQVKEFSIRLYVNDEMEKEDAPSKPPDTTNILLHK